MRLLAYARVSTEEQGQSGLGLEAQLASIKVYCVSQGYEIAETIKEVESAGKDRPLLEAALERVVAGEFDGIIAAKLDRFSRSVVQADEILTRVSDAGRTLIALDLGVDTSTAAGRLVMNVLASVAQWERDIISERTKSALRAKRQRGERLGRPRNYPDATRQRVRELRRHGNSYREIIRRLEEEGITTSGGGPWRVSSIQRLVGQDD